MNWAVNMCFLKLDYKLQEYLDNHFEVSKDNFITVDPFTKSS